MSSLLGIGGEIIHYQDSYKDLRVCNKCGKAKVHSKYHKNSPKTCKKCYSTGVRARRYGVGFEFFDDESKKQGYKCANERCDRLVDKDDDDECLHLDHCHDSDRYRSMLCHKCNGALGNADDNIERIVGLIEYLVKHNKITDLDKYEKKLTYVRNKEKEKLAQLTLPLGDGHGKEEKS